jgi:hypothetical protein
MNNTWIGSNMLVNTSHLNEYGLPSLTRGGVRVEWVNLEEGMSGDYDESDPNDVNLLRFDVSQFDGEKWIEVPDASYCTMMPASSPHQVLKVGLKLIMDAIYDDVNLHGKAKRTCESLSWIKPQDCVSS